MSRKVLLLVKGDDDLLTGKYSKKIDEFRNSQECDIMISQEENRFTSMINYMHKYDYIFWTDDVNSLRKDIVIENFLREDVYIVVGEDKHLWLVKCNAKVRKLLYHWSQSVKDIYVTERWKTEVMETSLLNVVDEVIVNDKNQNFNIDKSNELNFIVQMLNDIDQTWILVSLTLFLVIISTKL